MERGKTIEVVNSLITINNDRIEGYLTALKVTDDFGLKTMFEQFISNSEKFKHELVLELNLLGDDAVEGTKVSGKFFRLWMDVKAVLTGHNRKAILKSCEYGEDRAKEAYDKVLENDTEHLSPALFTLIYSQSTLLKEDHDQVKTLRDALAYA